MRIIRLSLTPVKLRVVARLVAGNSPHLLAFAMPAAQNNSIGRLMNVIKIFFFQFFLLVSNYCVAAHPVTKLSNCLLLSLC